jgi:sugar lactone lactonase YvrE
MFGARKSIVAASSFLLILQVSSVTKAVNPPMTLTPTAVSDGFSLSTFAINFPTNSNEANGPAGPLGIAFSGSGVLVTDAPGNIRLFPTDTDGQDASLVPALANYARNNALGLVEDGGNFYMAQQPDGDVAQVNPTTGAIIKTIASIQNPTGICVNPKTGHLIVSSYQIGQVWDVDPTTGVTTLLLNQFFDGVSTDGTTLYGADAGDDHVIGYNLATKQQVFDSGVIAGDPDGTTLGSGKLAGNLFANTNGGTLIEINLTTDAQTVLADNGTRGDFVTVDPNNGTLLLTQTDSILRLTAPAGSGFGGGGGSSPVPLPAAAWQILVLLGSIGLFRSIQARFARKSR